MTATRNLPATSAQQLATILGQLRAKSRNQPLNQQSEQDQCEFEAWVAEVNRKWKANRNDPELMAVLDSQLLQSADSRFVPPLPIEIDPSQPSDPDTPAWQNTMRDRIARLNYSQLSNLRKTCHSRIALLRRAFPSPDPPESWQNKGAISQRLRQCECLHKIIVAEMCRKESELAPAGVSSSGRKTSQPTRRVTPEWRLDRGERAARLHEELKKITRACKELKTTNEAVFRDRFPQFQLWKAIDDSGISERERERFFGHRFPGQARSLAQLEFIGQILGVSGHTIHNDCKLYRKANRDRVTADTQSESQSKL